MTEAGEKSWWLRNRKWVLAVGCLGFPIVIAGYVSLVLFAAFAGIRSSTAYSQPVELAVTDTRVVSELGSPVEPGWFVTGSAQVTGPAGNANMAIPLRGPEGKGTLYVVAEKIAGKWHYEVLEVEVADREQRIDLLDSVR